MDNIFMPKSHKILKVTKMTDIEYLFRVEFDRCDTIQYGQFMQISLPQVGECPISITDFSVEEGWAEFLIRRVGIVTDKIFKLQPGDVLPMRGPYGHGFNIDNYRGKNLIVAAGGSGVAPVRSLINYVYNHQDSVKGINLIFGFKDSNSILFKEDVEKWQKVFNTTITVDKPSGASNENVGLITQYVPQLELLKNPDKDLQVIIVGPPIMMKFTALKFGELGIPDENIWVSFERKMSCAVGKCGHCRIDETYVCLEGPVFKYSTAKQLID